VTATEPPKTPDFFQTAARAGLALIPGLGGALQVIYEDVRANIAYRQWQTIQEIADNVGEATLAEQLDDDPVRQALFVNGVEVATRTGLENKRRLLAKVVSAAMLDDFKIDGAQLRVEALRDLDVPQIKALERLHRLAVEHAGREDDKSIATAYHEAVQAAWLAEPYPVRAALTRTGVAFALMGTYGGFSVEGINEFGSGLLAELHDVDAFDWEGTWIAPADAGASEQPSSERASQPGRREQ
jgi:hypothetical protein